MDGVFKPCLRGFKKAGQCLGITAVTIICFTIATAISISMIVIGAINFKECPASPNIPIFMIGHGAVTIVLELFLRFCSAALFVQLAGLAQLAFFICGCVWAYGAFEPQYDPAYGDEYCDKTLYLFALIFVSIINGILALGVFLALCYLIFMLIWLAVDTLKGDN